MALVDTLDFIPEKHPRRKDIVNILKRLSKAAVNYQDSRTGIWHPVVDQGERKGNYLEASAFSLLVYALAYGVRKGCLDREYATAARKGFERLVGHLIARDRDGKGQLYPNRQCGGLGRPPKKERDC
jgi:unsaturated rhamnogalacturonyl hydrolase